MGKWYDRQGNVVEAFKLPNYRSVGCIAHERNGSCEWEGLSWIEGGWEGFICYHPDAEGNKGGWLLNCPKERE